jgi:hypothetical protein
MMYLTENGQLAIKPSHTPLGAGVVVVAAGSDEAYEVLGKLIDWILKTNSPQRNINGINWSIYDDTADGTRCVTLRCSIEPHKQWIRLYSGSRLVEIVTYLFRQFYPLTPELRHPFD